MGINLNFYKQYQYTSNFEPKHSKDWEVLTEEYQFSRSVGMLSPKTLRLLTEYTKKDIEFYVKEWKANDEQKEALHQSGLDLVKRNWNRKVDINTDTLRNMYLSGVKQYIEEHKRLS